MIEKNIHKIILSGILLFSFFSCSLLQKKYIYNSGEVRQDIYSDIKTNEKIGVQDIDSTNIKGHIISENGGLPEITLTFKNIRNKSSYTAHTDFDGFYSINIPAGAYLLKIDYYGQENLVTNDKSVFEFKSGEIRKLDWYISIGPETSVSYSIEFKNKRAYKKTLKKANKLNLSLLEYVSLEE